MNQHPKLRPGQSYKNYYEINYDFKVSPHSSHEPLCDDSNYKSFLTKPLVGVNEDDYGFARYSLDAYLESACILGAEIWVDQLIGMGASTNKLVNGRSMLMLAAEYGQLHLIELLVNKGCDINLRSQEEFRTKITLFHSALIAPEPSKCLKIIFDCIIKNSLKIQVMPLMHYLVARNKRTSLKKAVERREQLNARDSGGLTAVGWAIILDRIECLKVLNDAGASLDDVADFNFVNYGAHLFTGDAHGLILAIEWQNTRSLIFILESGIKPNNVFALNPDHDSECRYITPLELAVMKNYSDGVALLLKFGASTGFSGAFCKAASLGYLKILMLMAKVARDVNIAHKVSKKERKSSEILEDTPLALAAENGHTECIGFLLSINSNPNRYSRHETSYFPSYTGKEHPSASTEINIFSPLINAVRYLLSLCTVHVSASRSIKTVIKSSCFFENVEYYRKRDARNEQIRLEFGGDHYKPLDKNNVLSLDARRNIVFLLHKGADVNHSDEQGNTALSILISAVRNENNAIKKNHNKLILAAIVLLIKKGAIMPAGQLHLLLKRGHANLECVRVFVEIGLVKISAVDDAGNTLLAIAKSQGDKDIMDYLAEKELEAGFSSTSLNLA
jgi:ankyrin repeat protein